MKEYQAWEDYKRKYEWKPPTKIKEKKEKPVRKVKVAKKRVKQRSKVDKSPDAGKENAIQTWKNIFSPKNINSTEEPSQPKKKVPKKSKTRNSKDTQTQPMLNFLVARDKTDNH